MKADGRKILLCNCERTMALDGKKIAAALGAEGEPAVFSHLCRAQIDGFSAALDEAEPLLVACTQEAPLFRELAGERNRDHPLDFVNIRERAGWCGKGADANPKIAALLAEAAITVKPAGMRTIASDGSCLVYGSGQAALDVARRLAGRLDVSLLLVDPQDALPPSVAELPVYRGRIVRASGHLGNFDIVVDGYAPLVPASRAALEFVMPRDGAKSACSLIFDMSGGTPLFTGHDKRDGYFRVDPNHPAGIAEAMFAIADMVGEFEKPLYVGYDADICAHGRNKQVGCSNCLDACPAGAIAPDGDIVIIDDGICGGCGSCSAACPTGAVSYVFPQRADLIRRAQTLVSTYIAAGGKHPVLLLHDDGHGSDMISALARQGEGLPVNVLPLSLFTVTLLGHEILAAALLTGVERIVILAPPSRQDELEALRNQIELVASFLSALGYDQAGQRIDLVVEPDPDKVGAALQQKATAKPIKPQGFAAVGGKRDIARAALNLLRDASPAPQDIVPLPAGAPYGRIQIDTDGCTLCLACVSCCPADALHDNPDRPEVRFIEQACVQCGLCAKTCPEKVITLEPRYNFSPAAMAPQTLHGEDPFDCVRCGKPFGSRGTVERISAQLAGKHTMFQSAAAQELIKMCDDCRIIVQAERADNPFSGAERPRPRTTEDYLAAREAAATATNGHAGKTLSVKDFLADDD